MLYPRFTDYDIRFYMLELLKALEYSHASRRKATQCHDRS